MNVLRSLVFATRTEEIAGEINHGRLSGYLLKPVNFMLYTFSRDLAEKSINLVSSIIEVFGLILIFHVDLKYPHDWHTWVLFLVMALRRSHLAVFYFELHDRMLGVLDFGSLGAAISFGAVFGIHRWRLLPIGRAAADGAENYQQLPFPLPGFFPTSDISWKARFASNYQWVFNTAILDFGDLRDSTGRMG